ncbi:MAG: FAD-dependent oxidoreductase, partial [Desulfobacterales bacterium]|nr:FAD-dependent oxidoreductase [Desulfobacterales bacterium]
HTVALCEEKGTVGGLLRLAAIPPGRGEIGDILNYLNRELENQGVDLRLNTALTPELLDQIKPDTVVLTTGSLPDMPIIKGLFKTGMDLCTVTEVLEGKLVGDRVLVLGGNQAGLVLTDYLAEKGKEVVVLNRKKHFAEEMSANDRFYLRERLKRDTVKLVKQVTIKNFSDDGVTFVANGETVILEGYNSVVVAEAMTPVRDAKSFLKNRDIEVHMIGDAKAPRNLMLAMSEAEELGREL